MKISSDFLIRMKIYTVVLTVLIQLHFFQINRRASMRQCMDAENLHRRLKKILGQVQAIDRMIDEDVPCEDVLAQINGQHHGSRSDGCTDWDNLLHLFLFN